MERSQTHSTRVPLSLRQRAAVRDARRRLRRTSADLDRMERILRENEEALRAARAAAEESDRARHRFLANMSHELRTPLHSIIGFASFLLSAESAGLSPDARHLIRRIHANGSSLLRLVEMLLDLSKIEAGWVVLEASHVDVLSLARATAEEMKGQVRNRPLELVVEGEEGLDPIETDAGKLKLVLINLLGNALKYTSEGRVTVRLGRDPASRRPGRIDVVDTGPGVPTELRPSILEVLETGGGVTRRDGRTCLGLGIAAALARQIGGRIGLEDGPGTGAAFRVDLPMGIPTGAKAISPRDHLPQETTARPNAT